MKRRLPTTNQGEIALAAISLPPLTDDANRHRPAASHPGKAAAASNAAPIAASANRPASAAGPIASPPSSTASAANAMPSSPARPPNRPHPPPGRGMRHAGPRGRRPDPARAPGHLPDHRADRLRRVQPPGQHERRQQRVAHRARRAPHPRHEHLRAAAVRQPPAPDMPPVARTRTPAARRGHDGQSGRGTSTFRPAATYASTGSGHGHTMATGDTASGSLPAIGVKTRRGRIPHVQHRHQNPGPHGGSQEATSSPKSTATHAAEMLSQSGRQQNGGADPLVRSRLRAAGSPGDVLVQDRQGHIAEQR